MAVPARATELYADAESLGALVFRKIGNAICDGTLESGEVLRVEDLRGWLGVSRTPIREALSKLAALGLVDTQPGRYTRVSRPDSTLVTETIEYLGLYGGATLQLSAGRSSDDELRTAIRLLDAVAAASDIDAAPVWRSSVRLFVDHISSMARSRVVQQTAGEIGLVIECNLRHHDVLNGSREDRRAGYLRLREALMNRDPEYAEFAFRTLFPARAPDETPHLAALTTDQVLPDTQGSETP